MKPIFISATGTDAGKSYVSRLILKQLLHMGLHACLCKPIESGANPAPEDALGHLKIMIDGYKALGIEHEITLDELCFLSLKLPASPLVSAQKEKVHIDIEKMKSWLLKHSKKYSPLLIEGAGGLLVPILEDYFMIDLARDLRAHVLLVLSGKLGGINEALLSMEALDRRGIPYTPLLNIRANERESFREISAPFWASKAGILRVDEDFELLISRLLTAIE